MGNVEVQQAILPSFGFEASKEGVQDGFAGFWIHFARLVQLVVG